MQTGLDLAPIPPAGRTASTLDVLLLFAGANIVTTTLVTGGSLAPAFSFTQATIIVLLGMIVGTLPLALLARLGPRYGLPSMVVLRHPFGTSGAALISLLLIVTNFAWIAVNNVIAAEAMAQLTERPQALWSVVVGAVAIGVALFGPRAMALFDRIAVPLLILVGVALTVKLFSAAGRAALTQPGDGSMPLLTGLDLVAGYQVSWSLMFADYTRFQAREAMASRSVFFGLTLSSAWLMLVGAGAGLAGGGNSPTDMILGLGLPVYALLLMALSTVTTNFVNIYLSSLALKNLWPKAPQQLTVLVMGGVGTALGLASPHLLDRYTSFMVWIATLLLPIVAITLVHFFTGARVENPSDTRRLVLPGALAWFLGAAAYLWFQSLGSAIGATLPALVVTATGYWGLRQVVGRRS